MNVSAKQTIERPLEVVILRGSSPSRSITVLAKCTVNILKLQNFSDTTAYVTN